MIILITMMITIVIIIIIIIIIIVIIRFLVDAPLHCKEYPLKLILINNRADRNVA